MGCCSLIADSKEYWRCMTASSTIDVSDLRYSGRLAALLLDVRPGSKTVVHFLQVFLAMPPVTRVRSGLDLV